MGNNKIKNVEYDNHPIFCILYLFVFRKFLLSKEIFFELSLISLRRLIDFCKPHFWFLHVLVCWRLVEIGSALSASHAIIIPANVRKIPLVVAHSPLPSIGLLRSNQRVVVGVSSFW